MRRARSAMNRAFARNDNAFLRALARGNGSRGGSGGAGGSGG